MSAFWLRPLTLAIAAGCYLVGAIPFGLLLTRMAGLGDIRSIGSGNIGATNVLRTGRRGLAAGTLLLDGAKGVVAVQAAGLIAGAQWMPLAAIMVVAGHCFPIWLRFRGGKGVATGLGAVLALDWRVGAAACLAWLAMFGVTRISSASALAAFAVAPLAATILAPADAWMAQLAIAALVCVRHRANIVRLLAGTEPRAGSAR